MIFEKMWSPLTSQQITQQLIESRRERDKIIEPLLRAGFAYYVDHGECLVTENVPPLPSRRERFVSRREREWHLRLLASQAALSPWKKSKTMG